MPEAYTLVDAAIPGTEEVVKGPATQIVLTRRTVRMAAFGRETEELWYTPSISAARAWQAILLADERIADVQLVKAAGEPIEIHVLWCFDRYDEAWTVGSDTPLWNLDLIETSQPLMSHPYFGRRTAAALTTVLMDEMAKCDSKLLTTGEAYAPTSTDPAITAIMQRYNGLKRSGVEEWSPAVVVLSKRYRLFKSQTGDQPAPKESYKYLLQAINRTQTLAAISPPADILNALNSMESISYPDDGAVTPTNNFGQSLFWVRQKPVVQPTGNNPNGPRDVTLRWLGVQQASLVLYPPAVAQGAATQWDPQK